MGVAQSMRKERMRERDGSSARACACVCVSECVDVGVRVGEKERERRKWESACAGTVQSTVIKASADFGSRGKLSFLCETQGPVEILLQVSAISCVGVFYHLFNEASEFNLSDQVLLCFSNLFFYI